MSEAATSALPPDQTVRRAGADDARDVARVLGSAFSNDPLMNWVFVRRYFGEQMYLTTARALYLRHDHVYLNDSGTGAAMWLPPGVSPKLGFGFTTLGLLGRVLLASGFAGLSRAGALEQVMNANHPDEPHFYLHAIGAHLDHQGRGIGSALLKNGLADVDAAHMPAYLESSNVRNNPLYERYGFEVTGEHTFKDGPSIWFMWRPAQ